MGNDFLAIVANIGSYEHIISVISHAICRKNTDYDESITSNATPKVTFILKTTPSKIYIKLVVAPF